MTTLTWDTLSSRPAVDWSKQQSGASELLSDANEFAREPKLSEPENELEVCDATAPELASGVAARLSSSKSKTLGSELTWLSRLFASTVSDAVTR